MLEALALGLKFTTVTVSGPPGPLTDISLESIDVASTATLSVYTTVIVCVVSPGDVIGGAEIEALGGVLSMTDALTLNVPFVPPTLLPEVSRIAPGLTLMVYVPLSEASHDPPGAATT